MKFTAPIRRGLVLAHGLLVDSFDMDAKPSASQVKQWTKRERDDFNKAMSWLEWNKQQQATKPEAEITVENGKIRAAEISTAEKASGT